MLDSSYSLLRFWDQGFFVDIFYIIFFPDPNCFRALFAVEGNGASSQDHI